MDLSKKSNFLLDRAPQKSVCGRRSGPRPRGSSIRSGVASALALADSRHDRRLQHDTAPLPLQETHYDQESAERPDSPISQVLHY